MESIEGKDLLDTYAPHHDAPIYTQASDDDVYKEFIGQFAFAQDATHADAEAEYRLIIRSKDVNLAAEIPEQALREQLDYARTVQYTPMEVSNLRGMTAVEADGTERHLFTEEYIAFRRQLRLPEYQLTRKGTGYELTFRSKWKEALHWEIPSLTIVSELRYYHLVKRAKLTRFERGLILGHFMNRAWDRLQTLLTEPNATMVDFGTRRRNSKWLQWFWNGLCRHYLGEQYRGTSNMALAMEMGSANPIGTNAHELYMLFVAIARIISGADADAMRAAVLEVVRRWFAMYPAAMRILLPDTYTSAAFYRDAGADIAEQCAGFRVDSKEPISALDEFVDWLMKFGVDPMTKIGITSDGNDAEDVVRIYRARQGCIGRLSSSIGTFGTNGFDHMPPNILALVPGFQPKSLVTKLSRVSLPADWARCVSAVKLSDNLLKATGEPDEIEFYKKAFQVGEIARHDVFV